jgi:hypothetical protein
MSTSLGWCGLRTAEELGEPGRSLIAAAGFSNRLEAASARPSRGMIVRSRTAAVCTGSTWDRANAAGFLPRVKIVGLERFEGRGWLDLWANSSTVLGTVEISVITTGAGP